LKRKTRSSAQRPNLRRSQGFLFRIVERLHEGPLDAGNIERKPVAPA
jgi:hypothetical protein